MSTVPSGKRWLLVYLLCLTVRIVLSFLSTFAVDFAPQCPYIWPALISKLFLSQNASVFCAADQWRCTTDYLLKNTPKNSLKGEYTIPLITTGKNLNQEFFLKVVNAFPNCLRCFSMSHDQHHYSLAEPLQHLVTDTHSHSNIPTNIRSKAGNSLCCSLALQTLKEK